MRLFNAQNKSTAPATSYDTLLIVMAGESNSRGLANNTEAASGDLGTRAEIKIYYPPASALQDMVIKTGTFGYESNNHFEEAGVKHGMELGLANAVRDNDLDYPEIYLSKAGKGGSRISEWNVGGAYYTNMKDQLNYIKAQLDAAGKTYKLIIWYSQGINDLTNGLSSSSWRTSTEALFSNIRSDFGATTPIIMTKFMTGYTGYNTTIDAIDAADPYTIAVDPTGAAVNDPSTDPVHWSAAGFLTLVPRMVTATKTYL